ncbi:cupin domain-containing protein [Lophiostoma macrostomum CBS 122681]|uniref:Cupin domain-containing protein n=1 Tax=Lophiostoma macrostomum CBS 122681 TaxID=1314788 RepID=A0A6A6SLA2_9PLEO|nr:cupin domain-containing protein [Lophiostoma macrostomum CBS 122681]
MVQEMEILDNGLPAPRRYITNHKPNGKTGFSQEVDLPLQWQQLANRDRFSLAYATEEIPVNLNDDKDIAVYRKNLADLPGITIPGGTVLRMVDIAPGNTSPMHRTVSCDYGVVLEGEVELLLDSGAKTILRRGDITIQRGTNHAWRNTSDTQWARMLYFLQDAQPITVDGKPLDEDYGVGMDDVRPSNK